MKELVFKAVTEALGSKVFHNGVKAAVEKELSNTVKNGQPTVEHYIDALKKMYGHNQFSVNVENQIKNRVKELEKPGSVDPVFPKNTKPSDAEAVVPPFAPTMSFKENAPIVSAQDLKNNAVENNLVAPEPVDKVTDSK